MNRRTVVLGLILFARTTSSIAAGPPETVASTPPRTPAEEKASFHLPEGFVAELVAAEPEIHKPLNIAFDDQGRLWVTETLEYPFAAPEGRTPRDGVKILSDFGPDGHLDNTGVYTVPPGYYFMMGDNRDNSIDSRVEQENGVGLVPAENLVGKANIILFSWKPGASLWKPWTWFTHLRPSRFFHSLK